MDTEIRSARVKVENKQFFFDLRENQAGRYLKITEISGRRSTIIIPEDGLAAFRDALLAIMEPLG